MGGGEELNARDEEGALAKYEGVEFPPPPLENTEDIIALRTPLLLKEGRAMHHCVASHLKACLAGTEHVYRVGPCNAGVSSETLELVRAWAARPRTGGESASEGGGYEEAL